MMAKERPILMSSENTRGILAGRKTQTRRVINPQPQYRPYLEEDAVFIKPSMYIAISNASALREHCPYGKVGDRLWVKETFGIFDVDADEDVAICYKADDSDAEWFKDKRKDFNDLRLSKWRPNIHMYKWAVRIWLEITGIRVERVQDISESDAVAEGLKLLQGGILSEFAVLWNSIHKKEHRWSDNPWVWVIEFKKIERK